MGLEGGGLAAAVVGGILGCLLLIAFLMYLFYLWMQGPKVRSRRRLDGKTVVITGANTGIGKETALDLSRRGAKVVMLCRSAERGEAAAAEVREATGGDVTMQQMDLASLESVRQAAAALCASLHKIDILINNAGVMVCPEGRTVDGFETQMGTNHLGHFLLTNLLLPLVMKAAPGARIITVSSGAHMSGRIHWDDMHFDKTPYSAMDAYCQSKLANVLFSKELAKRLYGTGINTYSLHPGAIRTELGRHIGETYNGCILCVIKVLSVLMKTPEAGSRTTRFCAVDESLDDKSGRYYSDCREKTPAAAARSPEDAARLWDMSAAAVGLYSPAADLPP